MPADSGLTAAVLELLCRAGFMAHRVHCGLVRVRGGWMDTGEAGWPDIVVLLSSGRTWWIETKSPNGVMRKSQIETIDRLRTLGHEITVARDLRDVEEKMREMAKGAAR